MRQTRLLRPIYAENFRCIGPECEDTCCQGWLVGIDKPAFDKYRHVAPGPLRDTLDASIVRISVPKERKGPAMHAAIRLLPSGDCPFLTEKRLCGIQEELGAEFLCNTCANYPRSVRVIDGLKEQTLALSCPEAARMILLEPGLTLAAAGDAHQITWDDRPTSSARLISYFWVIRDFTVRLLLNRDYSLWQRLFLLGAFSRRLDALARGEIRRTFPRILADFSAAVHEGSLRTAMDVIQPDLPLQLTLVLRLVNLQVGKVPVRSARLRETLQAFAQGIGHQPGAAADAQFARYEEAYRDSFAPFFAQHPHILENYLLNQIFRSAFPFGPDMARGAKQPRIAQAYAALVTQFALMKGLLIGVAGHYGPDFSAAHVVQTVQTVSRHFEHSPEFLGDALALLRARKMDDARGLTMLVRN